MSGLVKGWSGGGLFSLLVFFHLLVLFRFGEFGFEFFHPALQFGVLALRLVSGFLQ
jgi:hypothetical protein